MVVRDQLELNMIQTQLQLRLGSNGYPLGNPPTHAGGTGSQRVAKDQPVPYPQRTLPKTHAGSQTRDNPYAQGSHGNQLSGYPLPGK